MNKIGLGVIALLVAAAITFYFVVNKAPGSAADQALITAAHENKLDALKKAIADGANANAAQDKTQWEKWFGEKTYDEGNTALMYASQWGNLEAMKLLLEKGAKINAKNEDGATPLMFAANHLRKDAVEMLLKEGADVMVKTVNGTTAMDAAKKRNATPETRAMEQMIADAMAKKGVTVRVSPAGIPQ